MNLIHGQNKGQGQDEGQIKGQGQDEDHMTDIKNEDIHAVTRDAIDSDRKKKCKSKRTVKVKRKRTKHSELQGHEQGQGHDPDGGQSEGHVPDIKEEYNYIVLPVSKGADNVTGDYRIKKAIKAKPKQKAKKSKEKQCKKESKKGKTEDNALKMPLNYKCIVCAQCFTSGKFMLIIT